MILEVQGRSAVCILWPFSFLLCIFNQCCLVTFSFLLTIIINSGGGSSLHFFSILSMELGDGELEQELNYVLFGLDMLDFPISLLSLSLLLL